MNSSSDFLLWTLPLPSADCSSCTHYCVEVWQANVWVRLVDQLDDLMRVHPTGGKKQHHTSRDNRSAAYLLYIAFWVAGVRWGWEVGLDCACTSAFLLLPCLTVHLKIQNKIHFLCCLLHLQIILLNFPVRIKSVFCLAAALLCIQHTMPEKYRITELNNRQWI